MQHLPVTARAAVLRHWGMGGRARTRQESIRRVLGVELLSKTEMAHYFPHSDITTEQFLGLPKSLVAVRRGT